MSYKSIYGVYSLIFKSPKKQIIWEPVKGRYIKFMKIGLYKVFQNSQNKFWWRPGMVLITIVLSLGDIIMVIWTAQISYGNSLMLHWTIHIVLRKARKAIDILYKRKRRLNSPALLLFSTLLTNKNSTEAT